MLSKIIRKSSPNRCILKKFTCRSLSTKSTSKDKEDNVEEEDECCCEPKIPDSKREVKTIYSPKCKVAFVTGGTSGIGFAAAAELLCAGAKHVVLNGIDECQGNDAACMLKNTFGSKKSSFIKGNVSNTEELEEAFKKIKNKHGQIDILVNSAGILSGKRWEQEFKTNVIGMIKTNLLAFKYIGKDSGGPGGVIINLSGTPGGLEPLPPAPTISACWHAIVGFSRSVGIDITCKHGGVRMMALCPGFTRTDFCKNIASKGMTKALGQELKAISKASKKQKPDVCGRAVLHLIKHAESGTVWWIEGSRLFSLKFPEKECFSTLEAQYL